jgi:hypothetical protein
MLPCVIVCILNWSHDKGGLQTHCVFFFFLCESFSVGAEWWMHKTVHEFCITWWLMCIVCVRDCVRIYICFILYVCLCVWSVLDVFFVNVYVCVCVLYFRWLDLVEWVMLCYVDVFGLVWLRVFILFFVIMLWIDWLSLDFFSVFICRSVWWG